MPGKENKQNYTFNDTDSSIKEYNYPIVSKINNNKTEKTKKTQYVKIPAPQKTQDFEPDPNTLFIQAAIAELYRALGPPDGAPKYRVEVDKDGKAVSLLSKVVDNFQQLDSSNWKTKNTLNEIMIPAAAHFALMYLFEEFDLNPKNIDITQNIRIDFGQSFVDHFQLYMNKEYFGSVKGEYSFTGKYCYNSFFRIHPMDLQIFPNMVIAKPWNLLFFRKNISQYFETLNQASKSDQFNKIVHQYFLKSLLFGKELLRPILAAHLIDQEALRKFEDYIDARFNEIKIALVQVPKFRVNVRNHFEEYKENILAEIAQHNAQFSNRGASSKAEYYQGRIINVEQISKKLDDLHKMIVDCDDVLQDDKFAAYRKRMSLATGVAAIADDALLKLVEKQVAGLDAHLNARQDLSLEKDLLNHLQVVKESIKHKSPIDKARALFDADLKITGDLIKKERTYDEEKAESSDLFKQLGKILITETIVNYVPDEINNIMMECNLPFTQSLTHQNIDIAAQHQKIIDLFSKLIAYAEAIKERDYFEATAFLRKNNALLKIFLSGMKTQSSYYDIVQDMMTEINKQDDFLLKHKSTFEWLIRAFLNLFSKPEVTLGWGSVSTPMFTTTRHKKLCEVVNAVYELPSPSA